MPDDKINAQTSIIKQKKHIKAIKGSVASNKMDKTFVLRTETLKKHPLFKKIVRYSNRFHVHDPKNQAQVGDIVNVIEVRPLSKLKRYKLLNIVEKAK